MSFSFALETAGFGAYLLENRRLYWFLVGFGYFVLAVYSQATPKREYPSWFWSLYLAISGAILAHISSGYYFEESVTAYTEVLLIVATTVTGAGFFYVMTLYAANRTAIDAIVADGGRDHDHDRDRGD